MVRPVYSPFHIAVSCELTNWLQQVNTAENQKIRDPQQLNVLCRPALYTHSDVNCCQVYKLLTYVAWSNAAVSPLSYLLFYDVLPTCCSRRQSLNVDSTTFNCRNIRGMRPWRFTKPSPNWTRLNIACRRSVCHKPMRAGLVNDQQK